MLILILVFIIFVIGVFLVETGPVSSNKKMKVFKVEKGDNFYNIGSKLKKQNLIKSEFFYKIYIKINHPSELGAGNYELNEAMGTEKVVKVLKDKKNQKIDEVQITIKEGQTIKEIGETIEKSTKVTKEEFINAVSDIQYIKSIQNKYWFLTDSIFNEQIYYPIEGYLFPDTYIFEKENIDAKKIIEKILENTEKQFEPYKGKNIHKILTLASLIEKEAVTKEDRKLVSGVFYNRLNSNMSLGSDVTTYYAAKKSLKETLTANELSACNGYNTRCKTMIGLPVGPICNPSSSSIDAAISPETSDYYYFVADTNKKVYFNRTLSEHNQTIAKLKSEGKWAA